ncbi:MAG: prefoldin subunit alpha [Archaeoglobaceae archaeon]|nr:prefoldin subunit alpha [Archaeoglobaceae archaeon]MCX8152328.1 prefoldin subunit alpha [Archaeoglobaceae archaeon]MDW8013644.1 prefoldin subunit alpha [Archaeoglobaceae archaeon]
MDRRLLILQQLQNEAEAIQRRILETEILLSEYNKTLETLQYFSSSQQVVEALMDLGGGVFAYVDVKNVKRFLVNVGAGVVVEKGVEDAIEFVKKRIGRVEETREKLIAALQQVVQQASKIQEEIEKEREEKK